MRYASLVGPLLGLYFPVPWDDDEVSLCALNTSKLENLWGHVYSEDEVDRMIESRGGTKLPENAAMQLDYDSYVVQKAETMGVRAMMYSERHKEAKRAKDRQNGRHPEIAEHAATVQSWMSETDADLEDMEQLRDALVKYSGFSHEQMLELA